MSEQTPKYLIFDKRPTLGTLEVPGESWDAYVVRKLTEEREYHARRSKQLQKITLDDSRTTYWSPEIQK